MGISALITTAITAVTTAASTIGAGAATLAGDVGLSGGISSAIGSGITSGLESGIVNGGISALEGKSPLKGFESGFLSGGASGAFGPWLGNVTGLGAHGGRALAGAAGGALGAKATGGSVLGGALTGGLGGYLSGSGGILSGMGGTSPAAAAAPASLDLSSAPGSVGSGDLSAPVDSTLPGSVGAGAAAGGNPTTGLPASPGDIATPGSFSVGGGSGAAPSLAPTSSAATGDIATPGSFNVTNPTPATATPAATGGLGNFLTKNPLLAMSAIGLLAGNRQPAGYSQLQGEASSLASEGRAMESYLTSGTLPPGLQSSISAASLAAKATIRSQYAAHGMSGSTAESQDLAGVDQRSVAQAAQIAEQLFSQGLSATGMANNLYLALMNEQMQQDNALSGAVGNLAGAMAMMGQPVAPGAGA